MHTLVLGGIRSGKSGWAERLAARASRPVRYLATSPDRPGDADWASRLRAHRERRPAGWSTVEVGDGPSALPSELRAAPADSVLLVDDVGNWLVGAFDAFGAWEAPDPWSLVSSEVNALVEAVSACVAEVILVSPEVGWTVVPATRSGRVFTDAQGAVNQRLAEVCQHAVLVVAGRALRLPDEPDSLLT